jgi:hypothetical protein
MILVGQRMHGWMLILHMSFAPLFALCVAALAILWAETHSSARAGKGARLAFWVVIAASFTTIATAMLLMMTWFGSIGQEKLLTLHRLGAMALVIAASYQAGRLCCSCCGADSREAKPAAPPQ